MIRMHDKNAVLSRLNTFDDNPSLAPLYRMIAEQVANRQMEVEAIVSQIAMPILRHYLGDGEPVILANAHCEKLKGLFGILIDGPYQSACQARFEAIAAIILEE